MAVDPAPLDPLPIPQLDQQQQQPRKSAQDQLAPQQLPPGAGFTGKGGQWAFYADNLLRGVMAGRQIREEKKIKAATQEVGGARNIYEAMADQYKTAIDNGVDQNSDQFKKLKQNTQSAWDNYINSASKYVSDDAGTNGKKKKGKEDHPHAEFFKKAFGIENPHLITEASLNTLKQTGPLAFQYTPDKAKELQRREEEQRLQMGQNTIEAQNRQKAKDAENDALLKERDKAITAGDDKTIAELDAKLAGNGYNIQETKSAEARALEKKVDEEKLTAIKAMEGGKSRYDLSESQQVALGIQPPTDGLGVYLRAVGPGKQFKTQVQAVNAYMAAERRAVAMGEKPSAMDQVKQATRIMLDHELQNPQMAKRYGIDPLKPGEKTPEWLVDKVVLQEQKKEAPEDIAARKVEQQKTLTMAVKNVRKNLPDDDQKFLDNYVFDSDDAGGVTINYGEPDTHLTGFYGFRKQTVGDSGLTPEEFRKKKNEVIGRTKKMLKAMYPDAPDETVDGLLGLASGPQAMTPKPEGSGGPATAGGSENRELTAKPIPSGGGRHLVDGNPADAEIAQQILSEAGGDADKARQLAKDKYNYSF